MTAGVAVVAQADGTVGTGHLVEALEIVAALEREGTPTVLATGSDAPAGLLARARGAVESLPSLEPATLAGFAHRLRAVGVGVALVNLREVTNAQIAALSGGGLGVLCIDEVGGRRLDCAAVINPSPIVARHRYTSNVPGFRIYAGPRYLALSERYGELHAVERRWSRGIQSVVVALGGVDRSGSTLRAVGALADWPSSAERHVVIGVGCAWGPEVERLLTGAKSVWRLHRSLPGLADLLAVSDVAISAGGNTLCELACVGTPALVLFEDDHEGEQGRAFEGKGFGVCLGRGTEVPPGAILEALDRFEDPRLREAHAAAGRRLVDGKGAARVCRILAEQLAHDSTVPA